MRGSLCRRFSHPILRSAPRYTISLTMLFLLAALSQDSYQSPHETLPPISVTSRLLSHKRISLSCDRHLKLMARSRRIRPGIANRLRRAWVVQPAASPSKSASSRRRCSPAALSPHCSARRASHSWLRLPVVQPFMASRLYSASCRRRRRHLQSDTTSSPHSPTSVDLSDDHRPNSHNSSGSCYDSHYAFVSLSAQHSHTGYPFQQVSVCRSRPRGSLLR
jgi:hypothetical protein